MYQCGFAVTSPKKNHLPIDVTSPNVKAVTSPKILLPVTMAKATPVTSPKTDLTQKMSHTNA